MKRPLIDPRLAGDIASSFPSKCTIQQVIYRTSTSNQQIPIGGIDIGGMIDLPCALAAESPSNVSDTEVVTDRIESRVQRRTLKLVGYFPQIVNRDMRAKVDGVIWQIRGVEHDSQRFSTKLRLEIITP